jgi:hypothetical protein
MKLKKFELEGLRTY